MTLIRGLSPSPTPSGCKGLRAGVSLLLRGALATPHYPLTNGATRCFFKEAATLPTSNTQVCQIVQRFLDLFDGGPRGNRTPALPKVSRDISPAL